MNHAIHIDAHGHSRCGARHEVNHDHYAIAALRRSLTLHQSNLGLDDHARVDGETQARMFVVADGVSGGPKPGVASGTAVECVTQYLLDELPARPARQESGRIYHALREAFVVCQRELRSGLPEGSLGMGTTLTLAFVTEDRLFIAHAGDSRAFLLRGGRVRRLTTDHDVETYRGKDPGRAPRDGDGSALWNAVGGYDDALHVQVEEHELRPDDVLALITDGISLDELEIAAALDSGRSAKEMCDVLLRGAGGDDRTAIVARFLPRDRATVPAVEPTDPSDLRARRAGPRAGWTQRMRRRLRELGRPRRPAPARSA